jgi:hypothetical protein
MKGARCKVQGLKKESVGPSKYSSTVPYTLNPTPYTLSPEPYTLHPLPTHPLPTHPPLNPCFETSKPTLPTNTLSLFPICLCTSTPTPTPCSRC